MVFDSQIIGALPSTIENQYVMLSGEGGTDLSCPNGLTLPASIHQPVPISAMAIKTFSTKLAAKGTTYIYPLLARTIDGGKTELLQIAPIPPVLVYDGFEKDLDAVEVIEQVLSMDRGGGG